MGESPPDLVALLLAGVAAVEPGAAVRRVVSSDGALVRIGEHPFPTDGRIQVLALGKAAPAMVQGLAVALPSVGVYGTAVTSHGQCEVPAIVTLHGSHPVPSVASVIAGRRMLAAAAMTPLDMPTVFLVSGGGSAQAEVPLPGVTLSWIRETTTALLRSGAHIDEINTIRRHVSAFKGGGLAAALRGPQITVAISDVVGSPPHAIASGPTVVDPTGPDDATRVAEKYGIELPDVERSVASRAGSRFVVAADAVVAAKAVVVAGEAAGVVMELHTAQLMGEASEMAGWAISVTRPGSIGVFAGETTVTLTGDGRGGRNQEAALAAALDLAGTDVRFAAMGTDGIDGMSPAAGAAVDGATVAGGAELDAAAALANNDSFTYLDGVGATIVTGPTGTNVGDLWVVDKSQSRAR